MLNAPHRIFSAGLLQCLTENCGLSWDVVRSVPVWCQNLMISTTYNFRRFGLGQATLFLGLFLAALLGGCSSSEVSGEDPESLYKEAEESFTDERYLIAIEKYRDLKNRYPYSSRARDAELRIADAYFAQESYLEAESAYEIFKELHPTHPKIDYVQYRIGMSYFNQIPDNSARDLSAAHRAIDAFDELVEKHPKSEFAEQAKNHIRESRSKLAEHENYVADFYFQRKHFLSASYRYNALLKDFPKLGFDEEALVRLGRCYLNTRMYDSAKEALNRLLKEFPQSALKNESVALLEEVKKEEQKKKN